MILNRHNHAVICVHLDDQSADMVKETLLVFSLELQVPIMRFQAQDALDYLGNSPVSLLLIDLDNLPSSQAQRDMLFAYTAKVPTLFLSGNTSYVAHHALPAQRHCLIKPVASEVLQREFHRILLSAASPDSVALDGFEKSRLDFFKGKT